MEILNNYFEKEITANFDYCLTDKQKDSIIIGKNPIKLDDDVIVHIFSDEAREFYDLERLWQDGKEIDISDIVD